MLLYYQSPRVLNNFEANWSNMRKDMLFSKGRHDLWNMQLSIMFGPCGFLRLCVDAFQIAQATTLYSYLKLLKISKIYSQKHWIMIVQSQVWSGSHAWAELIPHFCSLVFSSWALQHRQTYVLKNNLNEGNWWNLSDESATSWIDKRYCQCPFEMAFARSNIYSTV